MSEEKVLRDVCGVSYERNISKILQNKCYAAETKGGAWEIANSWDDSFIKKYQAYSQTRSEYYKSSGKKFTCEDFVISIIIDFCIENKLPFKFRNAEMFDSSVSLVSADEFRNDLLKKSGASDLQSAINTESIVTLEDVQAGDIFLCREHTSSANHAQLVTYTDEDRIIIYQGNSGGMNRFPGASRIFDAGNPNASMYTGQPVARAELSKVDLTYINTDTKAEYPDYLTTKNIEMRRWKFLDWN